MAATPRRSAEANTEPVTAPVSDDADQLRTLVSSMLSGTYKEDFYLWDVASLCRAKPEFARQLLALIDRYHRLGQMSAAQHQKVKDKIEQTVAAHAASPSGSRASEDARARAITTSPLPAANSAAAQAPSGTPSAPAETAPAARASRASRAASAAKAPAAVAGKSSPTAESATAAAAAASTHAADAVRPEAMTAAELMAAAQRLEAAALAAAPLPKQGTPLIAPGTVLRKRYELQTLLGSGGMGSVYSALDRYRFSLGLPDSCVALKIVTAQPQGAGGVLALGREFHNAQQLSHPNVVNVYEIDHEGDASFYTMELLEGERLSQLLDRIGGPLPVRYALAIIRDIGAAIAHAHSRGVVHADLKPHNIFITYGGQVRVLDFGGLSHSPPEPWISDSTSPRRTSSYRTATPAYASCEQLEGHRAETHDDIYAIACIAYELLTGRHPFDCASSTEARAQRLRPARPPALRAERWRALRQGLAWERAQRPDRIEPWLEQLGVAEAAAHLPPTHQLTAATPRRFAIGRAVVAAALLLGLGYVVFGIELHGGVDWHQALTTAQTRLQSTRDHWQSVIGGGTPANTAPANTAPAANTAPTNPAPAASAAPASAGETAAAGPAGAGASSAARSGVPSTAARLAALRRLRATSAATRARASAAAADRVTSDNAAADTATAATGAATGTVAGGTATPGAIAGLGAAAEPATNPPGAAIGVQFAASSYQVTDTSPAARVVVRRTGSNRDDVRFVWWTVEDSAKADEDYAPLGVRTEVIPSGADDVTIYIPIISNPLRHQTASFYVALGAAGTEPSPAPTERATVTIERGG